MAVKRYCNRALTFDPFNRGGGAPRVPIPLWHHPVVKESRAAVKRLEVRGMEGSLEAVKLQLQLLRSKADDLQDRLLRRQEWQPAKSPPWGFLPFLTLSPASDSQTHREREALAAKVPAFLYACQPYFNQLENAARGMNYQLSNVTYDTYTRVRGPLVY